MNEEELKNQLLAVGASEEQIAKVDFAKMENIFNSANSIEELCKVLKENYPDFNEAEFKRAIAENEKTEDEAQDLSDEDLEAVAGGSVGSWLNKNKAWLIPVAAIAVVGIGYGIYKVRQNKLVAQAEEMFPQDKGKISKVIKSHGKVIGAEIKMDPIILE